VHLLRGAGRTYTWGSRTAIADFTGRPSPTAHPEAELWLGAHPGDPTRLVTDEGEQPLLRHPRRPHPETRGRVRVRVLDFTPTTEAALHPGITRDGMELIYHTPALEFAVPVLCIDGGSATRSPRPPAITDRRSCCARNARRWCTPSPAR
jgi:mannose-6-phosphate isomerase class I